jgi:hypothetical protein
VLDQQTDLPHNLLSAGVAEGLEAAGASRTYTTLSNFSFSR